MMDYAFATTWELEAPIDRVWATLADVERWQTWFPAIRRITVVELGGADRLDGVLEVAARAALPYELVVRVRVARVEAPHLLELTAVGDLQGSGRWTLAEEEGVTTARFELRVTTTKPWMNALAPAARPVFAWNHDAAMTAAGRGLARVMGVRLLANESGPVERGEGRLASATLLTAVVLAGAAVVLGGRRLRRG
jgi:uncharacterized protein YndB with AHSA1/START domain